LQRSNTGWIQTFTGKQFYPLDIREDDIDIVDIAHSLSMQCRYSGHSEKFLSVAEHSYHVSKLVPEKYALCGLLHDASEAYLSDIPRPLKPLLPEYKKWEENLEEVISLKYNVPFPLPPEVKEVDNRILKNEYELLMKKTHEWVFYGEKLDDFDIYLWQPEEAKYHFLRRFMDLMQ
jgi:uncharacterized protein